MKVNVTIVKEIAIEIPDEMCKCGEPLCDYCDKVCDYVEKKTGLRCGSNEDYADEKPTIASITAQHGYIPFFEW